MKFKSIFDLDKAIEQSQEFNHQIKGKRIRKQLQNLSEFEEDNVQFDEFQLTDLTIKIYVNILVEEKPIKFVIRLDNEYPFNQPQLHYEGTDFPKLKKCKDLLQQLLNEQVWGPSLTLQIFLKQIHPMAVKMLKEPNSLKWTYHNKFDYHHDELIHSGMKLFQIEEYQWKYMLKSTRRRMLGITDETLLIFSTQTEQKYTLQWNSSITELKDIKATNNKKKSKFELNITQTVEGKDKIIYLGGDSAELEGILSMINPIQMMERKIETYEKQKSNYDETIDNYSTLIDHYSQIDGEKTAKLIQSMKKLIESQQVEGNNKFEEHKHAQKIET